MAATLFAQVITMVRQQQVSGAGLGHQMSWLAPDHLLVRYAAKSRLFEQQREVSGVTISYQQVTR